MARRLGPRKAAIEVIDCHGHAERHAVARFCSHPASPLTIGAMSGTLATACRPRYPELCFWFRICAFHRETPINGVRKRAFDSAACRVSCFGGFLLVDSGWLSYVRILMTSHWCDVFREITCPKDPILAFSLGSDRLVGRAPGCRGEIDPWLRGDHQSSAECRTQSDRTAWGLTFYLEL